jgi:hypothetical protein
MKLRAAVLAVALLHAGCPKDEERHEEEPPRSREPTTAPMDDAGAPSPPSLRLTSFGDSLADQCNRLIRQINAAQEPIRTAGGGTPAELILLATTLELVAVRIDEVAVSDERLVESRGAYVTMVKELAKAARETAGALDGKDAQKATQAAEAMSRIGLRESDLVDEINTTCGR